VSSLFFMCGSFGKIRDFDSIFRQMSLDMSGCSKSVVSDLYGVYTFRRVLAIKLLFKDFIGGWLRFISFGM